MEINKLSKTIFGIRKVLGYATDFQIAEDWKGEKKAQEYLLKLAKKEKEFSTGGFKYIFRKGKKRDSVKIIPDFSFRVYHGKRK